MVARRLNQLLAVSFAHNQLIDDADGIQDNIEMLDLLFALAAFGEVVANADQRRHHVALIVKRYAGD